MLALHNLGAKRVRFTLPVGGESVDMLRDVLTFHDCEVDPDGTCRIELEPYGYRWLRIGDGR